MKTEITGLATYATALLLLLAGAWIGLEALPPANVLISQAVAASADYRAEQARTTRVSLFDERASARDDATVTRPDASDGAGKPPTIRRNFSSFYSDYDLTPLPKLATGKKTKMMTAEQRAKKVRRPALPKEINPPAPAPNAFAFCLFC